MSLLETLIALMIAAGVIAAGVEAAHMSQARTLRARLDLEAVTRTESLLAQAGTEIPLRAGRLEGADGEAVLWSLDMLRDEQAKPPPEAFLVTAEVTVTRDGQSVHQRLSTLKLVGVQ